MCDMKVDVEQCGQSSFQIFLSEGEALFFCYQFFTDLITKMTIISVAFTKLPLPLIFSRVMYEEDLPLCQISDRFFIKGTVLT